MGGGRAAPPALGQRGLGTPSSAGDSPLRCPCPPFLVPGAAEATPPTRPPAPARQPPRGLCSPSGPTPHRPAQPRLPDVTVQRTAASPVCPGPGGDFPARGGSPGDRCPSGTQPPGRGGVFQSSDFGARAREEEHQREEKERGAGGGQVENSGPETWSQGPAAAWERASRPHTRGLAPPTGRALKPPRAWTRKLGAAQGSRPQRPLPLPPPGPWARWAVSYPVCRTPVCNAHLHFRPTLPCMFRYLSSVL